MWFMCPSCTGIPVSVIDAERGAEQRALDVVHGERVPGEERLHVAAANEPSAGARRRRCARRPDRPRRPSGRPGPDRLHLLGDDLDHALDPPLRRHLVPHEDEVRGLPRLERRVDPHPGGAAHHEIAATDVAQLHATRPPRRIDDQTGIHPLVLHRDPAAAVVHLGAVVGRRVEVIRHGSVGLARPQRHRVVAFDDAAVAHEVGDDLLEDLRFAGHGEPELREVLDAPADLEVAELVGRAVFDHDGEIARQEPGVDEVTFGPESYGTDGHRTLPCGARDLRSAIASRYRGRGGTLGRILHHPGLDVL